MGTNHSKALEITWTLHVSVPILDAALGLILLITRIAVWQFTCCPCLDSFSGIRESRLSRLMVILLVDEVVRKINVIFWAQNFIEKFVPGLIREYGNVATDPLAN
jgi:hypothetical protein